MSHKEESKKINLLLGDVSWDKKLGAYYIDMRPAEVHYTGNIYNGKFDAEGVPMITVTDGNIDYFSINIAQYGFIKHAKWLESKDPNELKVLMACIDRLEKMKATDGVQAIWRHNYREDKYDIDAPWPSAMAQGEIISLYLRVYQINNDASLLETAIQAFNFLKVDIKDGGTRFTDSNGFVWLEEYPSAPHSFVLNGFIYAIFGIIDLYRVTGDQEVKAEMDVFLNTLLKNVSQFDCGYWSYYDLVRKELVRFYYQKNVHAPQMEVLHQLTKEPVYDELAKKWRSKANRLNFIFVQIMYRVLPRYRKLFK